MFRGGAFFPDTVYIAVSSAGPSQLHKTENSSQGQLAAGQRDTVEWCGVRLCFSALHAEVDVSAADHQSVEENEDSRAWVSRVNGQLAADGPTERAGVRAPALSRHRGSVCVLAGRHLHSVEEVRRRPAQSR